MILYNVTINVDDSVHDEWLDWMRSVHIPDVLGTGMFTGNKIFRITSEKDEGNTYCIQYFLDSMENYHKYQKEFAPKLQEIHSGKFRNKFVAFRTVMESID